MNNIFRLITGLFVLAIISFSQGCTNENWMDNVGRPVVFSAVSYYDNGPDTRTEYSGHDTEETFSGQTKRYERIDWVENDRIRIYSPEARTIPVGSEAASAHADYKIVSAQANGRYSYGTIANLDNQTNGLQWASGTNRFFAIYPAPNSPGLEPAGGYVNIVSYNFDVTIPPTQTLTLQQSTGIYQPDMSTAYMWAAASAESSQTDPVELSFRPAVTAFQFTVGSSKALTFYGFELSSTSVSLSGNVHAVINGTMDGCTFTCPESTIPTKIKVTFNGTTGISIPDNGSITFTVFAVPQDITNVTAKFITSAGTKTIALNENGQPYQFLACKKYRITNLAVPEAETWEYHIDEIEDLTAYGHLATTESTDGLPFTVKSYKTSSLTGQTQPVTWKLQYKVGGTWTDFTSTTSSVYDGKLLIGQITGNGGTTGEEVRADIARNHCNSEPEYAYHGQIEEAGTAALRARSTLPSNASDAGDGYFDLSKHPVYGNIDRAEQAQETANCYVITAPGKYKLPLVYGNAIRNGSLNAVSYKPTLEPANSNDNDHYMRWFLRHDDQYIQGPWITTDNGITVDNAVVVWQDVPDAASQILLDTDISVSGNYIFFEIKKDNIRPGNIVLAARSGSTIVWSWHLWVTEKDLTPVNVKDMNNVTHGMMKYNLGWTDATSASGYKWQDWDLPVRIVQVENGQVVGDAVEFTVEQLGESAEVDPNVGSNTFYQWGRKDPMLPANYGNSNKPAFSAAEYEILEEGPDGMRVIFKAPPASSAQVTAGHSIQHPNYQYAQTITKSGQADGFGSLRTYLGGNNPIIGNLWDANLIPYTNTSLGTPDPFDNRLVEKTVYDPCPPGFCVPYGYAFVGFTGDGNYVYPSSLPSGSQYLSKKGWNLVTRVSGTIFFPFCGARGGNGRYIYDVEALGYYWTAAPNNYNHNYALAAKFMILNDNTYIRTRHDQDRAACYSIRPVLQVNE